jgi:hypothetical protein
MSKEKRSHSPGRGLYVVRGKSGKIMGTYTIARPKKGPTSVTLSEIRTAVAKTHAARKAK